MNSTDYSSVEVHTVGNKSKKRVKLTEHIVMPSNIRATIGVTQFVMYNQMYNVSTHKVYKNGISREIPEGYYDIQAFIEAYAVNGYILKYDSVTMRVSLKGTWTQLHLPVKNYLGFTSHKPPVIIDGIEYYEYEKSTIVAPIYATGFPELNGPDIFIRLDGLNYPSVNENNSIARVPFNAGINTFITYHPGEIVHYLLTNQDIITFDIVLIDIDGNLLEINDAKWSMTISIHFQDHGDKPLPNFPTANSLNEYVNKISTGRTISKKLQKIMRRRKNKL